MIGRLLDFGRMEAGKMVYHREPEAVEAVVDAALRAFEPIRLREHVALTTRIAPDLPTILADRAMLSQALLNLLQNAAKYGGERQRDRSGVPHAGTAASRSRSPTTAPASRAASAAASSSASTASTTA